VNGPTAPSGSAISSAAAVIASATPGRPASSRGARRHGGSSARRTQLGGDGNG
jgi:hypothetical protein